MSNSNVIQAIDGNWYIATLTPTAAPAGVPPVVPPVVPPPPVPVSGLLLLPAGVTPVITQLDALTTWQGEWDAATNSGGKNAAGATIPGAVGTTTYPVTIGGRTARAFPSDYTNHGGFRYHVHYGSDTTHKNFIYSGNLYFDGELPAQMELDNNQVTADGKTYIYGVQCNSNDGFWDITRQDTGCHWQASTAKGNPKTWPTKTWLHFEIMSHRDDAGNITYDAVHFNGTTQKIGTTLASARNIGWGIGSLLVNFQLGGASSAGSIRAYANGLQVARW
jgi:hypothetical protein